MHLYTAAIIIFSSVAVGFGQKTFGDVRKCVKISNVQCQENCQKSYPDTIEFGKIYKCFEEKRNDFEACMKRKGVYISDSTECYPIDNSQNRPKPNSDANDIPAAAKCYKRCLKRARTNCKHGCTGQPSGSQEERKRILADCKNEDQIQDCLESEANNPGTN